MGGRHAPRISMRHRLPQQRPRDKTAGVTAAGPVTNRCSSSHDLIWNIRPHAGEAVSSRVLDWLLKAIDIQVEDIRRMTLDLASRKLCKLFQNLLFTESSLNLKSIRLRKRPACE
jgi:hypothetical protein